MSDLDPLANRVTAVERRLDGGPGDPGLETRMGLVERDVREIRATLGRLEPIIIRIDAQMPHLATKSELAAVRADLAEKPSRTYLWGVLAVLIAAYGSGLAALALIK